MTSVADEANHTTFRNLNLVISAQQILLNYLRIRTGSQGSQCFVTQWYIACRAVCLHIMLLCFKYNNSGACKKVGMGHYNFLGQILVHIRLEYFSCMKILAHCTH